MKFFRPILAAATSTLLLALISPSITFAHDQEHHQWQHRVLNPQEHVQWIKAHLEKDALMLEIKASQESVWEAYATAAIDLATNYGFPIVLPATLDAAAAMHLYADQTAALAQRIGKLADATDKLQAVLSDDQRKILDRIVHHRAQFQGTSDGERWGEGEHRHRGSAPDSGTSKPSQKAAVAAKPKN